MKPIYLDFNATTPIDPEVAEAMRPYLYERFGNPSSGHWYGAEARRAVEVARGQVADLLACTTGEIIFTSGGSESNNMVIQGVARQHRSRGRHIITSAIEHPAVLEPCQAMAREGCRLSVLAVDDLGRVDPAAVAAAIAPDTTLVTIMHANNEVGTVQPIASIAGMARERGVLMHTDAAQSVGKIPVDVDVLGVDFLSLAGHKLYAPKGVGALYIRAGIELPRLIFGADHEAGRRAGTENVLEIVGLGQACAVAGRDLERRGAHLRQLRDRLWQGLSAELDGLRSNGDPGDGLPNTLSVSFAGCAAEALLAQIGDRVAASAGAACHAAGVTVSSVLTAMNVPPEYAAGTIRFSVGTTTTPQEIDSAVAVVAAAARGQRQAADPSPAGW